MFVTIKVTRLHIPLFELWNKLCLLLISNQRRQFTKFSKQFHQKNHVKLYAVSSSASLILMRRWLACCTEEAEKEREWVSEIRKNKDRNQKISWVTAFATWTPVLLLVCRQHDRMKSGVLVCWCCCFVLCLSFFYLWAVICWSNGSMPKNIPASSA